MNMRPDNSTIQSLDTDTSAGPSDMSAERPAPSGQVRERCRSISPARRQKQRYSPSWLLARSLQTIRDCFMEVKSFAHETNHVNGQLVARLSDVETALRASQTKAARIR